MNQVNHEDIQHEWFMTYIIYAMNIQSHEQALFICETPKIQAQQSRVFGVFFILFYHQHSVQCAAVQEQYRNNTGTRPYAGCKKLFT